MDEHDGGAKPLTSRSLTLLTIISKVVDYKFLTCEDNTMYLITLLQNHSSKPHQAIDSLILEAKYFLNSLFGWFISHIFKEIKFYKDMI